MKLIIDIDDEQVLFDIKNRGLESETETDKVIINALYNGIPLDDVKAEIEKLNPVDYGSMFSYESHNGARDMKRDILDILDNRCGIW